MKSRLPKTRSGEQTAVRVLQLGCLALVVAMVLNAPSPNGKGGWRDQFVDGWRQAQTADHNPDPATPATEVATSEGGDR